jgi:hypothetical protein
MIGDRKILFTLMRLGSWGSSPSAGLYAFFFARPGTDDPDMSTLHFASRPMRRDGNYGIRPYLFYLIVILCVYY